ncbi:MAG: right-handed parallel beta-helix repeat-containing protein, partial [Planctomycetota bacterium]
MHKLESSNIPRRISVLAAVLTVAGIASAKVVYVDADASGANDGTSWEDAYLYLQDALMFSAGGDEIRVAQGIYRPDDFVLSRRPNMGREETFRLAKGMTLLGGYAGFGEPYPDARNVRDYETILSGDLSGNDGPGFTNYDENSYHVVAAGSSDEATVLDGFTITGGNANGPETYQTRGGGIKLNPDVRVTIRNCTIIRNRARYCGGGMLSVGWSSCCSTISNCRFISNRSDLEGGGLFLTAESLPNITNCIFAGNSAVTGGAIYNYEAYARIVNCTFTGNRASDEGGGVFELDGISRFENCILWANSDKDGADESAQITWGNPMHVDYCCIQGWTGVLGGTGNIDVDPCFADPGYWDANGRAEDANDDIWVDGDYHLMS